MISIMDRSYCPTLEEIAAYIRNPLFGTFCSRISETYKCKEKIEYSSCSMKPGWNIKYKKAGRTLCTIYPEEYCFTVMVVTGRKEKDTVEAALPDCTKELQKIYEQTQEGNGQRWLMIPLEDPDGLYEDVLRLIEIRRAG